MQTLQKLDLTPIIQSCVHKMGSQNFWNLLTGAHLIVQFDIADKYRMDGTTIKAMNLQNEIL